jgi:hypothetical protein
MLRPEEVVGGWITFARCGGDRLMLVDRCERIWALAPPGAPASWDGEGEDLTRWRIRCEYTDARPLSLREAIALLPAEHAGWAEARQRELIGLADWAPRSAATDRFRRDLCAELEEYLAQTERSARRATQRRRTVTLRRSWVGYGVALAGDRGMEAGQTFDSETVIAEVAHGDARASITIAGRPDRLFVRQVDGAGLRIGEQNLEKIKPCRIVLDAVDMGRDAMSIVEERLDWAEPSVRD